MKTFQFPLIKKYRKEARISQREFAAMIGASPQQLWTWENRTGDKSITTKHLARIADALGKRTDDFFTEEFSTGSGSPVNKSCGQ
jgi:transcriptional regulator with XRE-family HTH domain